MSALSCFALDPEQLVTLTTAFNMACADLQLAEGDVRRELLGREMIRLAEAQCSSDPAAIAGKAMRNLALHLADNAVTG